MRSLQRIRSPRLAVFVSMASFPVLVATLLVSCGTMNSGTGGGTGSVHVSLTDPPTCQAPNGNYSHVYVTIRSVQANISATADDNAAGWQELAPQLNTQPQQIDLFSAASTTCVLTQLGSNTALPVGTYQQIRLLLVPNSRWTGATPAMNNCGSQGFNCVVLADSSVHEIDLSSQANTGLKIPPGQIAGGPISVGAAQDVDLNIDFNSCASIVVQGNGQYRLKPVLTAEQVGTNNTGISGQIVDAITNAPIVGGTVTVAVEKQDQTGTDTVFLQTNADASGFFNFCPLPAGATFDMVAVAMNAAGVSYSPTIALSVPGGTNLGMIPLTPQLNTASAPTTFQGFVTATTGTAPASIDALVSAVQTLNLGGGGTLNITIPAESTALVQSTSSISVDSATGCHADAPPNSNCGGYALVEPAGNPSVGLFASGHVSSYSVPATGDVAYSIRAVAFVPLSGGTTDCMPSSVTVNQDSSANPLKATAGSAVSVQRIDFSGCL